MHISLASILTVAAFVGAASAYGGHGDHKHHKGHKGHNGHGHHHSAAKGKVFDHILQIWFENQDFETVAAVPGFTELIEQGILLDNFNAITHPSEPNYVAAGGGSNFGKGLTWKVYQENIPSVGYTGYKSGTYVRKHNPAIIFDSVGLNATHLLNIVGDDQFQKDVFSGNLPNWMFYTPDMNNDGHDTNATFAGDWLANFYKNTLSKSKVLDKTLILITFDEFGLLFGAVPEKLKNTTDSTYYTHFSTLSTVEHNWDLGNLGQQDANKTVSNVFKFVADKVKYHNIDIPSSEIPWNSEFITGLMTGKSYNQTHH